MDFKANISKLACMTFFRDTLENPLKKSLKVEWSGHFISYSYRLLFTERKTSQLVLHTPNALP